MFDREKTIEHAIQSVQSQVYPSVEHIIQDGGSTDRTLALVSARLNENTHLVSARDDGIYDAINKGIARSTGDVIGLMHSDDYFAHNNVLAQVADAFSNPNIDGVYGDLDYVSAADTRHVIRHWKSGEMTRAKLKRGWMPPHPTLYLRRSVFESFGAYDTSYSISADYDAILRWLWVEKIRLAYIPDVLVKMRVGGESNRSFERILKKSREDYRAIRSNRVGGLGTLLSKNASKIGQFMPNRRKE